MRDYPTLHLDTY